MSEGLKLASQLELSQIWFIRYSLLIIPTGSDHLTLLFKVSIHSMDFIDIKKSPETAVQQSIGLVSLVVRDYDEAIDFYVNKLGFNLVEDTAFPAENKRWVVVSPSGNGGANLLLAKANNEAQLPFIGNQTGGRVFLFLYTNDLMRDASRYKENGVDFVQEPVEHPYGIVAIIRDLYGNQLDVIQRK